VRLAAEYASLFEDENDETGEAHTPPSEAEGASGRDALEPAVLGLPGLPQSGKEGLLWRDLKRRAAHAARAAALCTERQADASGVQAKAERAVLVERLRLSLAGDEAARTRAMGALREAATDSKGLSLLMFALASVRPSDLPAVAQALQQAVLGALAQAIDGKGDEAAPHDGGIHAVAPALLAQAAAASPPLLDRILAQLRATITTTLDTRTIGILRALLRQGGVVRSSVCGWLEKEVKPSFELEGQGGEEAGEMIGWQRLRIRVEEGEARLEAFAALEGGGGSGKRARQTGTP